MFRWHFKFGYLLTVWGNLEAIPGNPGEIPHIESKSVGSKGLIKGREGGEDFVSKQKSYSEKLKLSTEHFIQRRARSVVWYLFKTSQTHKQPSVMTGCLYLG